MEKWKAVSMRPERLTDAGPKGGEAAFKESPYETMVKPQGIP